MPINVNLLIKINLLINVQDVNLKILYYIRVRNVKNILFEKNIFIYRLIWLVSYLVTWLAS